MSHPASNREEAFLHYISMRSSQPSRHVLKPGGPLRPEVDNIYMVNLGHYKWYES